MNKIDLSKQALTIVHENSIYSIEKKEGLNYHIDYFYEIAKEDEQVANILGLYEKDKLMNNLSAANMLVSSQLVENSACIIMNLAPQVKTDTNSVIILTPSSGTVTQYQYNFLSSYVDDDIEVFDFATYIDGDLVEYMSDTEYAIADTGVLKRYLSEVKIESNKRI